LHLLAHHDCLMRHNAGPRRATTQLRGRAKGFTVARVSGGEARTERVSFPN